MPDRRASRLAFEVLFLVVLAVGLTIASPGALVIGAVMVLGWLIVAALEWAAWRSEPHYGSGLPPRYYVPQISLPPRRPLEQVGDGYPVGGRDEAPTWIASPALRAEVLGEWPVAIHPEEPEPQLEEEQLEEEQLEAEAAVPEDTQADEEAAPATEPEPVVAVAEPEPVPEPEPEPVAAVEPELEEEPELEPMEPSRRRRRLWSRRGAVEEQSADEDPWDIAEFPVEPDEWPEPEPHPEPEPQPEPEPEPVAAAPEPEPEPVVEEPAPEPDLEAEVVAAAVARTARHRLDPLGEPEPKRWPWSRTDDDDGAFAEVPARPEGVRALPGRSKGED